MIAGWVLAAAAILAFAPGLDEVVSSEQSDFLPDDYGSVQAMRLEEQAFPDGGSSTDASATIVVRRADGQPLTEADQSATGELAQRVRTGVGRVTAAVTGQGAVSPNRQVQIVTVRLRGGVEDRAVLDAVRDLRRTAASALAGTPLTAAVVGDAARNLDSSDAFDTAFLIISVATVVLIIGLMLLIYRSPLAALLPVATVGVVSAVAPGVVTLVVRALGLEADPSFEILMTIVLYGVGTDYILFLLFRYRERLRAGDDHRQALATAVHRVGEVITSAAAAIMIAFCVLLLAAFGAFTSFGPGLAIAVAVMALAVLTLVPAVVALLGPRVFWPSKSWQRRPTGTVFARLGRFTGRRPAVVALASGGLMAALAAGALAAQVDFQPYGEAPRGTESARGMADLKRGFPVGALAPTTVYLRSDGQRPLDAAAAGAYAGALGRVPGVGSVLPGPDGAQVRFSGDRTVARIDLLLDDPPTARAALDLVGGPLRRAARGAAPPGTTVLIGGASAVMADIRHANNRDLAVILPVAGVLIAIILALLLRSLVAPVYLMLSVLLGFFSTLGAAVLAFQGIAGRPGLLFILPVFLYLFVVAIGTDYNILMIARLREEARLGTSPRRGAAAAIEHGGPSVAAAGVILAGTFASMMLVQIPQLREMGFGVSTGILLAAFAMSMFLVPSLTALLGRAAWAPGRMPRRGAPGSDVPGSDVPGSDASQPGVACPGAPGVARPAAGPAPVGSPRP